MFFLVASSFTTHKLMQYLKDGNLCRRHNLTSVSNVWEAASISLFWVPNGLSELPEKVFQISFHLHWQMDNGIFNRPIMEHTQILILVSTWWPRTRLSVLFHRRT